MNGRKPERRDGNRAGGFSLPELLVVMAILGIAIAIAIPLVNEQVRIAEVRAAAGELAVHLRAARMVSVTQRTSIHFYVDVDPENKFRYNGNNGQEKEIKMPDRVKISPTSDPEIVFKQNGSVDVASAVVIESHVSGALERWTATINSMGMATLVHERVN